jgi:RHS repeat-associated protein
MADGWITASYNALNQPVAIGSPATWASGNWMWFGYDPLGRCVKRVVGPNANSGTATYLYYDGWNLIQEGPAAGYADRQYVHGARVDEIVKQITPGNDWQRFFHYDARTHCTLQTDASGNIVEQYVYNAFGTPHFYNAVGTEIGYSPWGNRFLFTGREWLRDLKLYDYRNRLYQPELGRFMQPDPKEFGAGDYNLYRYCHNDPVNRSDPSGLSSPVVIVDNPDKERVIVAEYKDLVRLPAFKREFDKIAKNDKRNAIKDAESRDNRTVQRSPNGLKTNNTERNFGIREVIRDLLGLFGRHTDYGTGATSFYNPSNRQTVSGGDRAPIFGLANELGEMINSNNGTWGLPNSKDNDNRSIWFENQAREAYGADLRPYH